MFTCTHRNKMFTRNCILYSFMNINVYIILVLKVNKVPFIRLFWINCLEICTLNKFHWQQHSLFLLHFLWVFFPLNIWQNQNPIDAKNIYTDLCNNINKYFYIRIILLHVYYIESHQKAPYYVFSNTFTQKSVVVIRKLI